jgi:hypothetical protein
MSAIVQIAKLFLAEIKAMAMPYGMSRANLKAEGQ